MRWKCETEYIIKQQLLTSRKELLRWKFSRNSSLAITCPAAAVAHWFHLRWTANGRDSNPCRAGRISIVDIMMLMLFEYGYWLLMHPITISMCRRIVVEQKSLFCCRFRIGGDGSNGDNFYIGIVAKLAKYCSSTFHPDLHAFSLFFMQCHSWSVCLSHLCWARVDDGMKPKQFMNLPRNCIDQYSLYSLSMANSLIVMVPYLVNFYWL